MEVKVLVQVRLSKELVKAIDHRRIDAGCYRAEMIERLLRIALASEPAGVSS